MSTESEDAEIHVAALIADIRKMNKLAATFKPSDGPLIEETRQLIKQLTSRLRRRRQDLETMLERGESTAEDRKLAAQYIHLIALTEAELKSATAEAAN
jgi:hypothetical protein